nr:hypothetical protein [Ktedonobacteraceae bacterium]
TPISGIVAMVHLGAECLWLHQPKPSLDLMVNCLKSMWSDREAFKSVTYQTSQIHLCADIAHFPLTLDHLPNLVTHSIKRAVHVPSLDDLDLDDTGLEPDTSYSDDDYDYLISGIVPDGWGDDDGDLGELPDPYNEPDDEFDEDDESDDDDDDEDQEGEGDTSDENEQTRWDVDGGKVHWRGQRVEGIGFSPAGAMSAAWYDKILEERKALHKKPWMREIHKAGGWEVGMQLTRVEFRPKRPVLNEWQAALGQAKGERWFDDPYVTVEHLGDMWGFFAGLADEHDLAPESTYRGWMRLTTPNRHDSRRSRWPTSPLWQVVQRVPFSEGMPKPLKRVREAKPDLSQLDAEILGMFITRAMLRGTYLQQPAELAREMEAFEDRMCEEEASKIAGFGEAVRERARMGGKKLPYHTPLELPKRPRGRPAKRLADFGESKGA